MPESKKIDNLLLRTVKTQASDLHISVGLPAILRINGDLRKSNSAKLTKEEVEGMIFEMLNDEQKKDFEKQKSLDLAYEIKNVARFRVNIFSEKDGYAAIFRVIPNKIITLDYMETPSVLKRVCHFENGLILVTGPTGSGKSTTLAAMIDYINTNLKKHIITIEDPIEFVHIDKNSEIHQRQVGTHTTSFAQALGDSLRQDPDIVLIGEMRDLETISLALTAAETGYLVFGTLHTCSAIETINRIIDVFPEKQQAQVRTMFAGTIRCVIAQTLLKRKDKNGRIAAFEILIGIPSVANLIRENKIFQLINVMQTGIRSGMQTHERALNILQKKGIIESEKKYSSEEDEEMIEDEEDKEEEFSAL